MNHFSSIHEMMTSPQINNDGIPSDFWLFVAVATSIGILVMLVWEMARRADEFDWPEETTGSRALRDVRKQIESERQSSANQPDNRNVRTK